MTYTVIAPIAIIIPRKTKKDKRISLSLNTYRNLHYMVSNQVKRAFKELLATQIEPLPKFSKVSLKLVYFSKTKQKSDIDNWCSICNKFFIDSLVEYGKLEDDNYVYVPEVHYYYGGLDERKQGRVEITIREIL